MLICDSNYENIGKSTCKKILQVPSGFFITPSSFTVDSTGSDATIQAALQAALLNPKASRIYLVSDESVFNIEPQTEDNVREDSPTGKQLAVRNGQYRFRVFFNENLEYHKAIHSHASRGGKIILFDQNYQILGVSVLQTGADLKGMAINLFDPENIVFSDGSVGTKPTLYFSLNNPFEINRQGWSNDWSGIIPALTPLSTVQLAVQGTPTASEIIVKVTTKLESANVLGLVAADFTLVDGTGSDQSGSISGVTDNGDGTYTIAGTGFVSGDVGLVDADVISIPGWEMEKVASFTI